MRFGVTILWGCEGMAIALTDRDLADVIMLRHAVKGVDDFLRLCEDGSSGTTWKDGQ